MVQLTAAPPTAPSPAGTDPWAAIAAHLTADSPPASPFSPPSTLFPPADMAAFSATPLARTDSQRVVQCPDCARPLLESALAAHHDAGNCQAVQDKAAAAPLVAPGMKRRLSEASDSSSTSPAKKLKPSGTSLVITLGDGKKKLKLEKDALGTNGKADKSKAAGVGGAASSASKIRGPVDVDKQCGVINDKGFPCSRSLTCKTHSMGAKRSVPHRSQTYDLLLHEWQKLTKGPEFGNRKPVTPRVGPGSEAFSGGREGGKKKKLGAGGGGDDGGREGKREKRDKAARKAAEMRVGEWDDSDADNDPGDAEGAVDSDEEVDAVLRGLARLQRHGHALGVRDAPGPMGFASPSLWLGRNSKLARMREALGGVFVAPAVA